MQNLISYLVVVFIYLAVAVDFWRVAKLPDKNLKLHSTMIALALVLHGWLLYTHLFSSAGLNLGFYLALSAILWLTVLIYWLVSLKHPLYSLQAFVLPLAAVFAFLPVLSQQSYYVEIEGAQLLLIHVGVAFIAYSLFTFATLHAMLMMIAERSLHQKKTFIQLPSFPPLLVMEKLLFRVISIGFVLLTLTLISGVFFSEQLFGKAAKFNHKTIFSVASWLIYGWLLFGHYQYGWRGKKATNLTLIGFVLLLLAYVGSKFILQVLMGKD
ncbi:MAG: cytochrome c biogenesis protein CcsA [Methylophilaceae bacterium]